MAAPARQDGQGEDVKEEEEQGSGKILDKSGSSSELGDGVVKGDDTDGSDEGDGDREREPPKIKDFNEETGIEELHQSEEEDARERNGELVGNEDSSTENKTVGETLQKDLIETVSNSKEKNSVMIKVEVVKKQEDGKKEGLVSKEDCIEKESVSREDCIEKESVSREEVGKTESVSKGKCVEKAGVGEQQGVKRRGEGQAGGGVRKVVRQSVSCTLHTAY